MSSARRREWLEWLIASAAILGLTAFLMRAWLGGGLPISSRREVMTELTIVGMFKQEIIQGHLLSDWNPYWFSGFPWLRYLSYPLYYPCAALSAWGGLSLESVMILFYFIVMAGSGLAMFGYLRRLLGDWRAALVGAVIYEAFPYHNFVGVETWIHAAFWALLPLPLWAIEASRVEGRMRTDKLLLAGLALGCFPLVSSEYAILAGPFVVAYLALRIFSDRKRGVLQALSSFALVGSVALGTAAFFVLPAFFEMSYVGIHAKHGVGTTFTDRLLRDYSITPALTWYAIAKRFRLPASSEGLPAIIRSFWSVSWYPGIIASSLAALGLTAVRKRLAARFALVGLFLAMLLVTGPTFPFNFFPSLPVFGRLSPFRGMLLIVAFMSILAAFGMRWFFHLIGGSGQKWRRWLPWGVFVVVILLVVVDFKPSESAYQTVDAYFTKGEHEAYAWLSERAGQGRLWEYASSPRDQYLRAYSLSEAPLLRYSGYYDNGAPLHTWEQFAWTDVRTLLRLHDVRYVMLREGEPGADHLAAELVECGYAIVFESDAGQECDIVRIWERADMGTCVQIYGRAALDITQDFHHSFVALPEFVWREIAMISADSYPLDDYAPAPVNSYDYLLVDDAAARDSGPRASWLSTLGDRVITTDDLAEIEPALKVDASIFIERARYEDIYIEVQSETGGLLTVSESWYPHWRVWVDGGPRQVLRANWALLGVWLEPGTHRVFFRFQRPWYVYAGYAVTLLTMLALIVWWVRDIERRLAHRFPLANEGLGEEIHPSQDV